jgi:hypothetical protein
LPVPVTVTATVPRFTVVVWVAEAGVALLPEQPTKARTIPPTIRPAKITFKYRIIFTCAL